MFKWSKWRRRFRRWRNEGGVGALMIVAAPLAYLSVEGVDHQMAYMLSASLGRAGCVLGAIWGIRRYVDSWQKRLVLALAIASCGWLLVRTVEFRGFSGELVPQFKWKTKAVKKLPDAPRAIDPKVVDLLDTQSDPLDIDSKVDDPTAPKDFFTQFMGNHRDGSIDGSPITGDWSTKPLQVLWETPVGAAWSGFVVSDGLAITQEQYEGKDAVTAFELSSGRVVWRSLTSRQHYHPAGGAGPRATPTIHANMVFAQSSTGIVTSMALRTGKLNWSIDLLAKAGIDQTTAEIPVTWGRSGSPLIVSDLVVVPLGAGVTKVKQTDASGLIALDLSTGEERWRAGDSQISYASPSIMTISGKEQIVIVNEADVTGHEVNSGKVLWKIDWPGASNSSPAVSQATLVDEKSLLLSKGYGGGSKLIEFPVPFDTLKPIKTVWASTATMKTKFMSPVVSKDYVYGLSDGILECIRWSDGKRMWKDNKDGRLGHGQLLRIGDQLLCISEDGRLVLTQATPTKPTSYERMSLLEGITWNPLALVGDLVLVRNAEKAVCLRVKRN